VVGVVVGALMGGSSWGSRSKFEVGGGGVEDCGSRNEEWRLCWRGLRGGYLRSSLLGNLGSLVREMWMTGRFLDFRGRVVEVHRWGWSDSKRLHSKFESGVVDEGG
jgi:hypothetical protein